VQILIARKAVKSSSRNPSTKSVLIFGGIKKGDYPYFWEPSVGQEAYEQYQIAAYIPEIIKIRKEPDFLDHYGIFEQLVALAKAIAAKELYEIGSTLFSTIDKYEKCRSWCDAPEVIYIGVEPSQLLRDTAEILHPDAQLIHYLSHQEVPRPAVRSVGRSYQATSYAFQSTVELSDWVARFDASQDGLWCSRKEKDEQHDLFGNTVTLFSLRDFSERMRAAGFIVNVMSAQKVNHLRLEFAEVFTTCYRRDMIKEDHPILTEGKLRLLDNSVEDLRSIGSHCWANPRTVPVYSTKWFDSLRIGRALNFAGVGVKVGM
jgi:hypothetical protein